MEEVEALSPEILAKMKRIQFRMKSLVSEVFAGRYESAFKGCGIEFEEVRPYQAGDDIRSIDWNVTARTGEPFIKMYREERELTLMFLVDVSASMDFGTLAKFKSEIAAEVTALLAYTALKNNDKIGLIIFSDHVEKYIPPKKGRAHIWRVIREILSHRPKAVLTDLNLPLEYLNRVAKRKVSAFLISDFLGEGYEKMMAHTARHHDLTAISITDPKEEKISKYGILELLDAESGERLMIDTLRGHVRDRWNRIMEKGHSHRDFVFRKTGVDHIKLDTSSNYIDPLIQYFRLREKRR